LININDFRKWNKATLELLNIPKQWAYTTGKNMRVIRGTTGTHGERVDLVLRAIAPDIEQTEYVARDVSDGIAYCKAHGVKLINYSRYDIVDLDKHYKALDNMPKDAIFTAGSGNWHGEIVFPARHPEVIAVANYDPYTKSISKYSNEGPELDFTAPGHWQYNASGVTFDGTSYATPVIVACLALYSQKFLEILGRYPTRTECFSFLVKNSKDIEKPGFDSLSGYGMFVFPDPEIWINELKNMKGGAPVTDVTDVTDKPMFSDVVGHPQREAIEAMAKLGVTKGFPDGTLKPNEPITRADCLAWLYRYHKLTQQK
jgi:hypothetical protein